MEMIRDYANDTLDIWENPTGKGRNNADGYNVRLSTQSSKGELSRLIVTFYGNANNLIKKFARIKVSSLKKLHDRVYFALYVTDDPSLGYAIPKNQKKTARISAKAEAFELEQIEATYKGYYDLEFDETYGLYYIDLNKKRR